MIVSLHIQVDRSRLCCVESVNQLAGCKDLHARSTEMEDSPVSTATPTAPATFETEQPSPPVVESKTVRCLRYLSVALYGAGFVLSFVAIILLAIPVKKISKNGDGASMAPAPGPGQNRGAETRLFSPLPALAIAAPARSHHLAPYETICHTTINRDDCLAIFDGTHEAGDLKQWTVKAMEAAQRAVNELYILARAMKKANQGSLALQQCIDVFGDALGDVNRTVYLVKSTIGMSSGQTDVQTLMNAAMTKCETCGEGIGNLGSFPGSESITGLQAKHVNTMLSIALTFVNHLSTTLPVLDHYQNRRLLFVNAGLRSSFPCKFFYKIRQVFPK